MSRRTGKRGLVVVLLLLLAFLVVVDLLRSDSLLLQAWGGVEERGTPIERFVRTFLRRR